MKVREVRDAGEYLSQVYLDPVKLLVEFELTISSSEEQIKEAEEACLLLSLERDSVLLLNVADALRAAINAVKMDLEDYAEDCAEDCYYKGTTPVSFAQHAAFLGRKLNTDEKTLLFHTIEKKIVLLKELYGPA